MCRVMRMSLERLPTCEMGVYDVSSQLAVTLDGEDPDRRRCLVECFKVVSDAQLNM